MMRAELFSPNMLCICFPISSTLESESLYDEDRACRVSPTFLPMVSGSGDRRDSRVDLPAWHFLVDKEVTETKRTVFDAIGDVPVTL